MVYRGVRRPTKWKVRLQNCTKFFLYGLFVLLGTVLCMSENWVAMGIPILIVTVYKTLRVSGRTMGSCPYCGEHIVTSAGWAVVCRTCNQKSYVRYGQLLERPLFKSTTFRYQ